MPSKLEYYRSAVRRLTSAPLALLCIVTLPAICAAQFGSSSASTSSGTGGHFATGSVPSATGAVSPFTGTVAPATGAVSPPTGGPNFATGVPDSRVTFHSTGSTTSEHRHHHDHAGKAGDLRPIGDDDSHMHIPSTQAQPNKIPTPTMTPTLNSRAAPRRDRRGSGEDDYVPQSTPVPTPHADQLPKNSPQPQPRHLQRRSQAGTGKLRHHRHESIRPDAGTRPQNRPRRPRPRSHSKQNDDRGITFQLPPPPQAN